MQNVAKIAISLPSEDFKEIEEVRKEMGIGRSAIIDQAIHFWLEERKKEEMIKRYEEGYRKRPERVFDLKGFEKAELEVLNPEEDWS